jgi:Spy/CpxP family protein refolding chaperone
VSSNTRAAAIAVVVVAFVAGILVGVAGDHLYLIRSGRLSPRHSARFSSEHMTDRLTHALDLSPQQKTQVQQIIERHRAKIDATMASVRPQVRQELDATNAEIETVLTPEQKTKFANLRMRIGARRRDRNSPRP